MTVGSSSRAEGIKIGIATDLGYMPDSIRFHLRGCDVLLLESNHDLNMLKVGSCPWALKLTASLRRALGPKRGKPIRLQMEGLGAGRSSAFARVLHHQETLSVAADCVLRQKRVSRDRGLE
jgi:hypothetical protein